MDGSTIAGQIRAFAYLTADKARLYRSTMRAFLDAKDRFALHLRPQDVVDALAAGPGVGPDSAEVQVLLDSLCAWGNLVAHPDTAEVATVEEFYRPRYLYQLTAEGDAAEKAVAVYEETMRQPGELQTAALHDIRALLGELGQLAALPEPDDGKVHRTLVTLRTRFDELAARAKAFIGSLHRTTDLHGIALDAFLAYKHTLIEYIERFIGELVIAAAGIAASIEEIESDGGAALDRLLRIAARRDLVDAVHATDDERAAALERWRGRWAGLRGWFFGTGDHPAQAETLRARARAAIPALLGAVAGLNDRRVTRTDRVADLRTLARWFAETDSDADAHRLWRVAFGLAPSRHLAIDDATLADRDAHPVPAHTSWLEAPPLRISPHLRRRGWYRPAGRSTPVVDRTAEKARLAEIAAREAAVLEAARARLVTGRRLRLSELPDLDVAELDLFLDLLGEALARKVDPDASVEASSTDGTLRIVLDPTRDGAVASIATSVGTLSGPDHFVTIGDAFEREPAGDEPVLQPVSEPVSEAQTLARSESVPEAASEAATDLAKAAA